MCALLNCFSPVRLFATPWTVALQAPLSMGFSRQEYWNGLSRSSLAPLEYMLDCVLWTVTGTKEIANCFISQAPKANVGLSVQEAGPEVTGEQGKVAGDGVCG